MFSGHQPSERRRAGESVEAAAMWAPPATVRRGRGLSKSHCVPQAPSTAAALEPRHKMMTGLGLRSWGRELGRTATVLCYRRSFMTLTVAFMAPSPKIRTKPHHPRT